MTAAQLALRRAEVRLLARLAVLERSLAADEGTGWPDYLDTLRALAALAPLLVPGADGRALTTAEMAERLGISSRTLRRHRKAGTVEAVQLGERGRAALRWGVR
jgi:excisionase family DNA binding protein